MSGPNHMRGFHPQPCRSHHHPVDKLTQEGGDRFGESEKVIVEFGSVGLFLILIPVSQ